MFAVGKYESGSGVGGEPNNVSFHNPIAIYREVFFELVENVFPLMNASQSL